MSPGISHRLIPGNARRLLRASAAAGVRYQGVLGRLSADVQVRAVRFGVALRLQSLTRSALVVVDGWEETKRGILVKEQGERFTTPLETAIEFGISQCKLVGLQIGS